MNRIFKVLPLSLALLSGFVMADSDIKEPITKGIDITGMQYKIAEVNKFRSFVNIEIKEIVIKNTSNLFNSVNEKIKGVKDSTKLDEILSKEGVLFEYNTYNFTNVAVRDIVRFSNNQYRYLIDKSGDKKESVSKLNISSAYNFKMTIDPIDDKSVIFNLQGNTRSNSDYLGKSVEDNSYASMNSFNNITKVNLDEYTVVSSFEKKDTLAKGADKGKSETKLILVKIY